MSASASGASSFEHTQRRASGVPSDASMRKCAPPDLVAGMSDTGILTRPNVTVPDQKPRTRDVFSVSSGTLPSSLRAPEARLERARERRGRPPAAWEGSSWGLSSARLCVHQLAHAILVLVAVLVRLEAALERAHQLLGEAELFGIRLLGRRRLELLGRDDLVGG